MLVVSAQVPAARSHLTDKSVDNNRSSPSSSAVFRTPRHPQLRGGGGACLQGQQASVKYSASVYPLSKFVQPVIQCQKCGPQEKSCCGYKIKDCTVAVFVHGSIIYNYLSNLSISK